jgi:hypothetical protein
MDLRIATGAAGPRSFPPSVRIAVKALACELPKCSGRPLSRYSIPEIRKAIIDDGIVASLSNTTVWRWLSRDAIKPWFKRSWIFPRAPNFEEKAGRLLDLYNGEWEGKPLGPDDYILSSDEKTSIQARYCCHPVIPPNSGRPMLCEHEYERRGSLQYLAAWDVRRAKVFGRCEPKTGIVPFGRLVSDVMQQKPYKNARRVFWVVDNGSSHRGQTSIERMRKSWPNAVLVHTPVHASWLNQVEVYFSIVQRKVLTPNDFPSLDALSETLSSFEKHYEEVAKPFQWKYTRDDLAKFLKRLREREQMRASL